MKKNYHLLLIISIIAIVMGSWQSAQAGNILPEIRELPNVENKMAASLRAQVHTLQAGDMLTVIVTLRKQADLSVVSGTDRVKRQKNVISALQATANTTQIKLKKLLDTRKTQGAVQKFQALWVFNGFSVTASSSVIEELAQNSDVYSITSDDLPIVPAFAPAETNISLVNAPALWSQGYTGQGVVVANMDSGVDVNHPDLSTRWRGGSNSWFDPYGQHPTTPTDISGHGTWTMGAMVGGDTGGTTIGVAPNAQWIAVKIFNDSGNSTATAIHQGFQWLLDPDANPNTADAPNVINNSWTFANPGCYLDFEPDLQSLRAVGILPIFAAGNGGPLSNTSFSPSNNPSAFAVGAINNSSQIYGYSSRGPSTCGGSTGPFPELVAPGVNIRTTDLYGGYTSASGTSLAAPHVAGGLALLLSAYPNLTALDQQSALINSAVDLGASGPDDVYGYGRLDLLAAFNRLATAPTATAVAPTATLIITSTESSTPLPTFTSTTAPAATPTPMPTFTFTSSPTATVAATPTRTSTPAPTFTATSTAANTMHIGDLDRSSAPSGTKWNATVTIQVHNASEGVVAGATVTGKWTNGASGTVTCVTNSSGVCTITKTGLSSNTLSVTFTVNNIARSSMTYRSASNHDPDTDSTGTVIIVSK